MIILKFKNFNSYSILDSFVYKYNAFLSFCTPSETVLCKERCIPYLFSSFHLVALVIKILLSALIVLSLIISVGLLQDKTDFWDFSLSHSYQPGLYNGAS